MDIISSNAVRVVAAETAGTAEILMLMPPHPGEAGEWDLKSLYYVPAATSAANATNYATIAVTGGTAGSLVTVATSRTTAAAALTLDTPYAFTLTGGTVNRYTAGTDVLHIAITKAAGGVALKGTFVATWRKALGD